MILLDRMLTFAIKPSGPCPSSDHCRHSMDLLDTLRAIQISTTATAVGINQKVMPTLSRIQSQSTRNVPKGEGSASAKWILLSSSSRTIRVGREVPVGF